VSIIPYGCFLHITASAKIRTLITKTTRYGNSFITNGLRNYQSGGPSRFNALINVFCVFLCFLFISICVLLCFFTIVLYFYLFKIQLSSCNILNKFYSMKVRY